MGPVARGQRRSPQRRDTGQISAVLHDGRVDTRLGTAVHRVRKANGWRQADVAERSGISDSTISRIERGDIDDINGRNYLTGTLGGGGQPGPAAT